MLKLLRKYNRYILVIGGSLLMVVFLLPQALSQIGSNPSKQTVARIGNEKIKGAELMRAQAEYSTAVSIAEELVKGIFGVESAEHWLLLTKEAEEAGLVGGPQDAASFIEFAANELVELELMNYPAQFAAQRRTQRLPQIRELLEARRQRVVNAGTPETAIDDALAKARAILRLNTVYNTSTIVSKPAAMQRARNLFDTLTVQAVVVPTSSVIAIIPVPDAQRMEAHFEEYKDTLPEENEYGIGYKRPDAVELEWLGILRAEIEPKIPIDDVRLNKFWRQARQQNPNRYAESFAEARTQVEVDFRREETTRVLDKIDEVVRRQVLISAAGLPTSGKYKVLPADWPSKMPTLDSLADAVQNEVQREFGISDYRPQVHQAGDVWLTAQDVTALPNLGMMRYAINERNSLSFAESVFNVKELGGVEELGIQEGLIHGPVTRGRTSDRYYFRIVDTREAGPPSSLDEVKSQVLADVQMLDALKHLEENKEQFRKDLSGDVNEVLQNATIPDLKFESYDVTRESVRRVGTGEIDPRFETPEFREAVFEIVKDWPPTLNPVAYDPIEKSTAIIVPGARALVVAQVRQRRPLTQEQLRQASASVIAREQQDWLADRMDVPFSFERLSDRMEYEVVGARPSSEEEEPLEDEQTPAG